MSKHPYRGPVKNTIKEETKIEEQEMNKDTNKEIKTQETTESVDTSLERLAAKKAERKGSNKDLEVSSKKEQSRAEKKAQRRAGMQENGRLTLSDEYKEEGYEYRVCNVLPGNIENWKSRGYEIVEHKIVSGDGSVQRPEANGVPVEFEVGGANGSMKAVWMRIRKEDKEILDEIRDDMAKEQSDMILKNPVGDENDLAKNPLCPPGYGKVTRE